jgi:hypothetical protein
MAAANARSQSVSLICASAVRLRRPAVSPTRRASARNESEVTKTNGVSGRKEATFRMKSKPPESASANRT